MSVNPDFLFDPLLDELEEAFNISFDQAWFRALSENSQVDSRLLREVEEFFILRSSFENDKLRILEIARAIEEIVSIVRRFMIPRLRDKLHVSGFYNGDDTLDADLRIKYRFIAYAFPHNLDRLTAITDTIKSALERNTNIPDASAIGGNSPPVRPSASLEAQRAQRR